MTRVDFENLHALVIDDQSTMRSIIKQLLAKIEIRSVIEAGNGKDAFVALANGNGGLPDFIICDLHMAGMDGMEFCHRLRRAKNEEVRGIPVLVLTADNDDMMHELMREAGAASVLTKPISAQALGLEIRDAVREARAFKLARA